MVKRLEHPWQPERGEGENENHVLARDGATAKYNAPHLNSLESHLIEKKTDDMRDHARVSLLRHSKGCRVSAFKTICLAFVKINEAFELAHHFSSWCHYDPNLLTLAMKMQFLSERMCFWNSLSDIVLKLPNAGTTNMAEGHCMGILTRSGYLLIYQCHSHLTIQ